MKHFLTLSLALTVLSGFSQSKADDHSGIAKAVNYYLEGGTNGDFETLKRRMTLPDLYKYLKQQYWYKIHTGEAEEVEDGHTNEMSASTRSVDERLERSMSG